MSPCKRHTFTGGHTIASAFATRSTPLPIWLQQSMHCSVVPHEAWMWQLLQLKLPIKIKTSHNVCSVNAKSATYPLVSGFRVSTIEQKALNNIYVTLKCSLMQCSSSLQQACNSSLPLRHKCFCRKHCQHGCKNSMHYSALHSVMHYSVVHYSVLPHEA